ncbi:MAG: dockerin type I repeat-containing protein, partial [Muribaculaceae bacterium]|nr:dockerin type I repeat-containing protein [Muribaculaceae bacterium]
NVHLWVWSETYVGCDDNGGMNSFGELEDHFAMTVSNKGWSGLGIIKDGDTDFSFIDDTYVLHFGIKGHPVQSQAIGLGSIAFALGETAIYSGDPPVLVKNIGTWPDDGEWYYVDLPIKDLKKLGNELFSSTQGGATAYHDNFFWLLSGGTQGNEVHLDNVFLYKDSTLQPSLQKGDVNRDGSVNVSDVTALINMILGSIQKDEEVADVNEDTQVNVSDVTALINIILGSNA